MMRYPFAMLLALLFSVASPAHAAEGPSGRSMTTITVPAGSRVELINTRIVWMKNAQPGTPLYMQVNESLRTNGLSVIPAGTCVQATLLAAQIPLRKKDNEAILHLRFDKLIFPNGYIVDLAQSPPLERITIFVTSNSDILLDNGQWLFLQFPAPLTLNAENVVLASTLSAAPAKYKPGTLCRGTPGATDVDTWHLNGWNGPTPPATIPGTIPMGAVAMQTTPGSWENVGGNPGTSGMILNSHPNFDEDPVICAAPPNVRLSEPESNPELKLESKTAKGTPQTSAAALQTELSTLTVPSGVSIPLLLSQPVHRKISRTGTKVSATIAFPVTADGQVAIPMGSKVEGTIEKFKSSYKHTHEPGVMIHFTRLVYPNGYTLDAPATAQLIAPAVTFPLTDVKLFDAGWQFQMTMQSALSVDPAKTAAKH